MVKSRGFFVFYRFHLVVTLNNSWVSMLKPGQCFATWSLF